jgi:hypothetical protein
VVVVVVVFTVGKGVAAWRLEPEDAPVLGDGDAATEEVVSCGAVVATVEEPR